MATTVTWNGSNFTVPVTGEENWGGTTKVDGLLVSLVTHGFQKTGGTFTLTADADLGSTAGLKVLYLKSQTSNISTTGVLRLARADSVGWRNQANSADLLLAVDASNNLTFNGVILSSSTGSTSFTIANAQATPASITGLVPSASHRGIIAELDIKRSDNTQEVRGHITVFIAKNARSNTWDILGEQRYGDVIGMEFSVVSSSGQVQYTSDNFTGGGYSGNLQFITRTFNA